ncbi:MAG: glutamine synthetase family protein [Candidatus Bathyarchaeia archaeon]
MDEEEVLKTVEEKKIQIIRIEYLDLNSVLRSRAIMKRQLKSAFENGLNFSKAIMDFTVLEDMVREPRWGAETGDFFAVPDPNTFAVLPYLTGTARMFCDLVDINGKPWPGCTRTLLREAQKKARREGIALNIAFETENYLVRKEGERYLPADYSKCFSPDGFEIQDPVLREVINSLESMGVVVEKMTAEYGPGQYEVNMRYSDPLTAADNFTTYREVWRGVARKFNLVATFMPKPFSDYAGSGLHLHISAFETKTQRNLFFDEADKKGLRLSELAYHFIGGIQEHAGALCAVGNPTVNSFKRLLPGSWAPAHVCYGPGNRAVLIRIPEGRGEDVRIEFRSPDPTCNPYLLLSALIAAGIDGIKRKIDPGEPMLKDIGHASASDIEKWGIKWLPRTLGEALRAFKEDKVIREALGETLSEEYLKVRQAEWDEYNKYVSPWEVEKYLETY